MPAYDVSCVLMDRKYTGSSCKWSKGSVLDPSGGLLFPRSPVPTVTSEPGYVTEPVVTGLEWVS